MAMANEYELLDSGDGRKLERFGDCILIRPAAQAVWPPTLAESEWARADASFSRQKGLHWEMHGHVPPEWTVQIEGVKMLLSATDFGHLGVFPEHAVLWRELRELCRRSRDRLGRAPNVLNLFAYSGGATMALAQAGAEVCHLDAARGMVDWARRNAGINGLDNAPIRWIVDDALKFVKREVRRGRTYDAVILDPPSFGRGRQGQVFKIEQHLVPLLKELCALVPEPVFVLLTCHTPEFGATVLGNVLRTVFNTNDCEVRNGEILLPGANDRLALPCGNYALLSR